MQATRDRAATVAAHPTATSKPSAGALRTAPPAAAPPIVTIRCGVCGGQFRTRGARGVLECPLCRHRLAPPAAVRVECPRCHDSRNVAREALDLGHTCASCGEAVTAPTITLEGLRVERRSGAAQRRARRIVLGAVLAGAGLLLALSLLS